MMPFAAKGQISQDPLEGGIEITPAQYLEALAGMQEGLEVTIEGGLKIARPVPPEPPEPIPPTPEELLAAVWLQRDRGLSVAALRMGPLQDAVDIGVASAGDMALLTQWKTYRVALNRIQDQLGFPESIDWPEAPSDSITP